MTKMFQRGEDHTENVVVSYMNSQGEILSKLSGSLESIKEELHKTNTQISEHLSNNKIQLIETKTEILNAVLEKFVEKEDYASDFLQMETRVLSIDKRLENKVDKSTVKLLWIILSSVSAVGAWFYTR